MVPLPLIFHKRTEVKTMASLDLFASAVLLLEFATRVIELYLVIRSALLTRRGKERPQ